MNTIFLNLTEFRQCKCFVPKFEHLTNNLTLIKEPLLGKKL